jgi:hypothetical protein
VSVGPDPNVDQVEQVRRQINRLAEEIAHLSEMDVAPAEYYGEFLQRVLTALAAPAGAVWLRTPQGNLQLQYQIKMGQVGLDRAENSRQVHDELLRQAAMKGQPGLIYPQSSVGESTNGAPVAGNPTDYVVLLAPILVEKQVAGLVEIWQDPMRGPDAQRGFLQFLVRMASLASGYTRNHQLRNMVGQQQVWTQLEAFARQVHGSLNPTEVSYQVANEGRRLVECDRVSVAIREAHRAVVRAISGADVVEKRSNLVQLMRALFDSVLKWGEKLVYSGMKDDTLPPNVNKALDAFLAESNSKLLVVLPLKDERESESKKPPRSAIMMECFEPAASPEQLVARLEVVGRHATAALYNSAEHRRIPMRFLWAPLAKVQDGLGGKARAILTLVGVGIVLLIAALVLIPYPLKMEAKGQLLPVKRQWIFSPTAARVVDIKTDLRSGSKVFLDQPLLTMQDLDTLNKEILDLQLKIDQADKVIASYKRSLKDSEKFDALTQMNKATVEKEHYKKQLEDTIRRVRADRAKPGEFALASPLSGIVLTGDFREQLKGRFVKPNEPLLRIGEADKDHPRISQWEIELKIPQKHIGQVRAAFGALDRDRLDVDLLLSSRPTAVYKAILHRDRIAEEANPNRDDHNESEPVVLAWAQLSGDGIPKEEQVPPELLLTGIEVHSRVRCGNHAMGYSLFYGVWEFIYEKVVFFF